jgi:hypothetical protein
MYGTPRVVSGLCRTILLKILENISSALGKYESKAKDTLKNLKSCLLSLNPALPVGIYIYKSFL